MFRLLMLTFVLLGALGCSSKEKIEIPKNTKAGPTNPPITLGG